MKKTLLLLAGLSLFSCSSSDNGDENQNPNPNPSTGTKGKLKSIEYIYFGQDSQGNKTQYTTQSYFMYGNNGFVDKVRITDSYENSDEIDYYIYDGDKVIQWKYNLGSESVSSTYTYTDDLITKSVNTEGGGPHTRDYKYDSSKNLVKEVYSINGKESSVVEYTYLNGNVSKEVYYSNTNNSTYTTIYEYDNKKNPFLNVFPEAYLKIRFVGKNNIIKSKNSDIEYQYNSNGFPIKAVEMYDGEIFETRIYQYY